MGCGDEVIPSACGHHGGWRLVTHSGGMSCLCTVWMCHQAPGLVCSSNHRDVFTLTFVGDGMNHYRTIQGLLLGEGRPFMWSKGLVNIQPGMELMAVKTEEGHQEQCSSCEISQAK